LRGVDGDLWTGQFVVTGAQELIRKGDLDRAQAELETASRGDLRAYGRFLVLDQLVLLLSARADADSARSAYAELEELLPLVTEEKQGHPDYAQRLLVEARRSLDDLMMRVHEPIRSPRRLLLMERARRGRAASVEVPVEVLGTADGPARIEVSVEHAALSAAVESPAPPPESRMREGRCWDEVRVRVTIAADAAPGEFGDTLVITSPDFPEWRLGILVRAKCR
jgi:hypothetical protein